MLNCTACSDWGRQYAVKQMQIRGVEEEDGLFKARRGFACALKVQILSTSVLVH
jgi:hypothetical protein